ncbi:MAG: VWA domain-containing protein [Planctomycetota bacterium]|jgi:HEAT repeat protein
MLASLFLGAALPLIAPTVPAPALDALSATPAVLAVDDLDALVKRLEEEKEEVSSEVLDEIVALGTEAAFDALLDGLQKGFETEAAKRRTLRALAGFTGADPEIRRRALDVLEVTAKQLDNKVRLRNTAIETLGKLEDPGRESLSQLILQVTTAGVRQKALDVFAETMDQKDREWLAQIWREKVKARSLAGGPRFSIFEYSADVMSVDELTEALSNPELRVRVAALDALSLKEGEVCVDRARDVWENPQSPTRERAAAARTLLRHDPKRFVKVLIESVGDSTVNANQSLDPWWRVAADAVRAVNDPDVNDAVAKFIGKAKNGGKLFVLRALRDAEPKPVDSAAKKGLKDKHLEVRVAAIRLLQESAVDRVPDELLKLALKGKDESEQVLAIQAVSELRGSDPAWIEELETIATKSRDVRVKSEALLQLAKLGEFREELMLEAMTSENPGAFRAAIRAVEALRSSEAVGMLVAQLGSGNSTFDAEATNVLGHLSGLRYRKNIEAWKRWWGDQGDDFQPLSEERWEEINETRLELARNANTKAEFFGVQLETERIVFVVDVSGSMQEAIKDQGYGGGSSAGAGRGGPTRLDAAKGELRQALDKLEEDAYFNILSFSGGVNALSKRMGKAQGKHLDKAKEFVGRMTPGGGTNIYGGFETAFADELVDTIIFLSDGQPSEGETTDPIVIAERVKAWNAGRNVTVHCISIGIDLGLLRRIARENGGEYTFIR